MRLLVTNTHALQAYSITRCLRPYAEWIVATLSGGRPLGFWPIEHAAYSRLIDRRYRVPDPETDWMAGRIQPENTALEEAFIARILEICARENIDTIFPSNDAWVYVFSKNKARLEAQGIVIPVPELHTVITPLDKYQTILAAGKVGFPSPETHLAESDEVVRRIAHNVPPPWIIKLRFTTGRRGMALVKDADELVEKCRTTRARHGAPMIQDYIPGQQNESSYLVLDRDRRVVSALTVRNRRHCSHVFRSEASACETVPNGPFVEKAIALAQHINWWGGVTVQHKVDPRDGQPKLMEINPRLGINLWYRTELGINVPLMCLQIARGEKPKPEAASNYPHGYLLLKPFEDFICLPLDLIGLATDRFRTDVLERHGMDPLTGRLSMKKCLGRYWDDYFGKRKRCLTPYFRYAREDPLPLTIWISRMAASFLDGLGRRLGRRLLSVVSKKPSAKPASAVGD